MCLGACHCVHRHYTIVGVIPCTETFSQWIFQICPWQYSRDDHFASGGSWVGIQFPLSYLCGGTYMTKEDQIPSSANSFLLVVISFLV